MKEGGLGRKMWTTSIWEFDIPASAEHGKFYWIGDQISGVGLSRRTRRPDGPGRGRDLTDLK
jgi:hypothetical protein